MMLPVPGPRARRAVYLAVAAAIFIAAAWQRFHLPQTPLSDEDTWGYLYPPVVKLTGGRFEHVIGREFVYPAFLFLNLCAFGDFRAVAVSQHVLGMAGGVFLLLAWEELAFFLPGNAPRRVTGPWHAGLGWLLLFTYLCSENTILYEHTIRPEGIFPCFGALDLLLVLRFTRRRWIEGQPRAALPWGAAAVFVSLFLYMLRPAFALAVPLVNLPVLAAVWQAGRPAWREGLSLLGAPLLLAGVLLFLPERWLASRDLRAASYMAEARLAVHANLVRDQINADLATPGPLRYDRAELQAVSWRIDHCINASQRPGRRPQTLGFNADYLLTVEPILIPPYFERTPAGEREITRFANYYFFRVLLHRPIPMARKVLTQLAVFYNLDMFRRTPRGLYEPSVRLSEKPFYPHSVRCFVRPDLQERLDRFDAARDYTDASSKLRRTTARLVQPTPVIWLNKLGALLYLPGLLLSLGIAAGAGAIGRRANVSFRALPRVVLLLFAYNFGICLTVALVQTLGTGRYIEFQRIFTLFAVFAGILLCAQTLLLRPWRQAQPTLT